MKHHHYFFLLLTLFILASGCYKKNEDIKVLAWVPVYGDSLNLSIQIEAPRPVSSLERIYVYQQYIFAVEKAKGVHILDNSNPQSPRPIHFLSIVGTTELAIKDQYLYADQFDELVVLDIHNIAEAIELSRQASVFPNTEVVPGANSGYFQCPEAGKTVQGWLRDSIQIPDCFN